GRCGDVCRGGPGAMPRWQAPVVVRSAYAGGDHNPAGAVRGGGRMKKLFTVLGIIAALAAAVTWLIRRAIARARRLPPVPGTHEPYGNGRIPPERGGAGPPIVLLHGFAESTFTWRDIMPDLERDSRVFAVDLPPFGYSSRLTELDYSQRAQAERVVRIMD